MPSAGPKTHYELFGVRPDCSLDELRAAYRRLARERHPDVAEPGAGDHGSMAEVNEAWRVLSDAKLRRRYDATVVPLVGATPPATGRPPGSAPRSTTAAQRPVGLRRQAWVAGVQAQMARLSRQAGRSATQTLLIRHPRGPRSAYEAVLDGLVDDLVAETESRIRAARAAGAAPLDLGVAATLVGIRSVADGLRRRRSMGVSVEMLMAAELLDRMWDVLGHELPTQLTASLGGNPRVAQALVRD
jgi:curved DNA-binding protein CbpA